MTYIKIEQAHTDDERWIEAGADAFAVHIAALVYCDRQLKDGRISEAMAGRVSLAVPPDRTPAAIATLVEHGFWTPADDGYQIERFGEHAFPAEQIKRTRDRWKADKERRRQHSIGDHSLCKDPKFCPAIRSTVESTPESTGGGSHLYPTQPDQTRPDRREGSGSGRRASGGAGSAGATPARPPVVTLAVGDTEHDKLSANGATPWDISVLAHDCGGGHWEVFAQPTLDGTDPRGYSAEHFAAGRQHFVTLAEAAAQRLRADMHQVEREHNCGGECAAELVGADPRDEPCLSIAIPPHLATPWLDVVADAFREAFNPEQEAAS